MCRSGKICQRRERNATNYKVIDEERGRNDKNCRNGDMDTYGVASDVIGWKSLEPSTQDHTP